MSRQKKNDESMNRPLRSLKYTCMERSSWWPHRRSGQPSPSRSAMAAPPYLRRGPKGRERPTWRETSEKG